jgi:hypothetical protein
MAKNNSGATSMTVISAYPYVSRKWVSPKKDGYRSGAFRLYIDGRSVGWLPPLGRRTVDVPVGSHTVRVRFRWFRSKRIDLRLSKGQHLEFTANIPRGLGSFGRLVFQPGSAVTLEPVA